MDVVVEILTGCGADAVAVVSVFGERVVVDVVIVAGDGVATGGAATRIQHRTQRLRLRAPSTPAELVIPGLVMY